MENPTTDKTQGATATATNNSVEPLPADFPFVEIGHPDTMMSKESVRRAVEEFHVRPTDIVVATFAKTGTTLVTWICHLLRSKASTSVLEEMETLYEAVPWPLLSWDIGYDPNHNQIAYGAPPRLFKSHLRMASIYRGCRYIVTIRDPAKTALSFYNFFLAKQVPVAQEMNVSQFLMTTPFIQGRPGRASLWDYYQEYHLLKECSSVLVLVYEDLVKDMPKHIHMIAKFMNVAHDQDLIDKVATMSSKTYMAQFMTKFDEPYERAKELGRVGDLSQLAPGAKVVVQKHPQVLNEEAHLFLDEKWKQSMAPLAYENYQAFAETFRSINQQRFS
mgnify:CR=1 FL=1